MVGLYYASLSGTGQTVQEVSDTLDGYGWSGSWRITDDSSNTLWNANSGGDWLFPALPSVWVLNTITMEITASEAYGTSVDPVAEAQAIDSAY